MEMLTDARQRPDARLLVVEDEPNILELLSASLRYAGFDVVTAAAGTEAVQAAQRHRPDLIVLDVMLPDMDGFDVIRRLRGGGARIPVVFLTARDATEDKTRGLTLGGDNYVTKPFSLEEVIARIRAVLRRTRGDGVEPTPRLTFADLELDEESHEVWRSGEQIQLSPTELKLLRYFMSNANRVLSKMQILDHKVSSCSWMLLVAGSPSMLGDHVLGAQPGLRRRGRPPTPPGRTALRAPRLARRPRAVSASSARRSRRGLHRPVAMISSAMDLARSTGMAKPSPMLPPPDSPEGLGTVAQAVGTPTSLPAQSTRAPPLLPGLMEASVCTAARAAPNCRYHP